MQSYAGVPHLKGDRAFNQTLSRLARSTQNGHTSSLGGFSALIELNKLKVKNPMLVSTTDGVGTKLDLARLTKKHDTIGIDLVAMSVNDLITCGARPIFFLDYFATGAFDRRKTVQVIQGIARGCRESACALVGGETAIMPGFYSDSKYDLAGFAVGIVDKRKVIQGKSVRAGDALLGLASSGVHSNGFSLVRKVFTKRELSGKIGKQFLAPTRIYVRPVLNLIRQVPVRAIAHITGGGFFDNLPRVLPKSLGVQIVCGSWPISSLFSEIQKRAKYSERQMYHTFNMGIGMVVVVSRSQIGKAKRILKKHKISSWEIGSVTKRKGVVLA